MSSARRVVWGALALLAIIIIGVTGYMTIEGWSLLDSLYMTITTITTVGYMEVHPLNSGGRIFSIFLIVGGVGGALYTLTGIGQYIVEGNFGATLGRRRMKNKIARLKDHFILCGLGRVGEEIARTFKEEGVPFVVIDNRPDCIVRAEQADYLYLEGDATRDVVLREAGLERARGLVAALGSDADNTYITLSARGLCSKLFIEARASTNEAETKLRRAGADRIVSPHSIGARRMAMLALRPAVVDFVDTVVLPRGQELQIENVEVSKGSPLEGLTIEAARRSTGTAIMAIIRKNNELLVPPAEDEVIQEEDRLFVIGTKKRLTVLEDISEEASAK